MHLNCRGSLIDLSEPQVMGILNRTPDSFYAQSRSRSQDELLRQAETHLESGALFLDLGGYSSRPGAQDISAEEEIIRVVPAIEMLSSRFPEAILSVDTFRSSVARKSLEAGAHMINDISGGHLDPEIWKVVREHQVPYIAMHMRGTPQSMNDLTDYEDLWKEILFYFSQIRAKASEMGLNDLIIDPGFGFAKTREQNFELLNHLELFHTLEAPLLIGISRKSMIYKTLKTSAEQALNGSTALHAIALYKGAHILRTHDVAETAECIQLLKELRQFS